GSPHVRVGHRQASNFLSLFEKVKTKSRRSPDLTVRAFLHLHLFIFTIAPVFNLNYRQQPYTHSAHGE
ncbi:hypothetical protein, partial [Grimontia indica]|uniref:hypothetical protein n=1 Tax=Grimontia indica TaxID=1056512 RepID=UPI00195529E7